MTPPAFWLEGGPLSRALSPLGALVSLAGRLRGLWVRPKRAPVPVVCVGNLTVGGTGKTPTAIAIARALIGRGRKPAFVSRGYGGSARGPLCVDAATADARVVGDEAILLARVAPAWIGADRAAAAFAAAAAGADCLILDDGFQNPALAKDFSLVVIDGATGFGNGKVMPAGPLREPVARGLARADAALVMGEDRSGLLPRLARRLPAFAARLEPRGDFARLSGARVVAFAGIGRPQKFFDTLAALGAQVVRTFVFADHHPYLPTDIEPILADARRLDARPVTTEKDAVRIPEGQRRGMDTVAVAAEIDEKDRLFDLIAAALTRNGKA